jgi:sugar lactone lactonase YvrE
MKKQVEIILHQAELVFDAQAELGEGPFWHSSQKRLYWLDVEKKQLHCFDPLSQVNLSESLDRRVACIVPTNDNSFLLAGEGGIEEYWPETDEWALLRNPEARQFSNRLNVGKVSPDGRFWFGSLNMAKEPNQASLYVMEYDGKVRHILSGLINSNGLGWSPDGETFYHIDTPTRQISAFDYDTNTGSIRNRRVTVQFPDDPETGYPVGMTVDSEGMIWVAHWEGSCVTRWDPATGKNLATVQVPATQVTSVAFGGENLDTLYITTARNNLTPEKLVGQPHAGGLFAIEPGVTGLPTNVFRWEI